MVVLMFLFRCTGSLGLWLATLAEMGPFCTALPTRM